jgi:hypothetical protein
VFLYASRDHKIRRLISRGETQDKAIELVDTTDKARAAFVRQYLGLKWPEPHLYHAMFNTEMGDSCTATMLLSVFNSSSWTVNEEKFQDVHWAVDFISLICVDLC